MYKYYSDMNARNERDLLLLITDNSSFLNIKFTQEMDEKVEVQVLESGYRSLASKENLTKEEIYIISSNLVSIINNKPEHLDFEINFDNIYVNDLLETKVYIRRLKGEDTDYLTDVKAFLVALLKNSDYETVRVSKLTKYKQTTNCVTSETIKELEECLANEINEYKTKKAANYSEVKTKTYNKYRNRNLMKNIIIALLIIFIIVFYLYFYTFEQNKVEGYNAYLNKDYNTVVSSLNKYIGSSRLSDDEEVMVTKSIIETQNLSAAQKKLLQNEIDVNTTEDIRVYWSSIAASDYDKALESASIIGSIDLRIYAAIKYLDYLNTAEGESASRAEKIEEIETLYDELVEQKKQMSDGAL